VPFRNAFPREAEFLYAVDNPTFVLARASERLGPKKATAISVAFRPDAAGQRGAGGRTSIIGSAGGPGGSIVGTGGGGGEPAAPQRTGKLTVSCPKQTGSQWVFYLAA
jgi:hydrocephalus-inducing protein